MYELLTKIYYGHQYLDQADYNAVLDVLKSDYLTCGPKIKELEDKLCEVTGAKYAVACSNGTAALHIAALAAGVGNGDEVITTPITFAASANCALYCGGKPVLADINEKTYNIDPDSVEAHITPSTKAVVAVDYTGQAVELDRLQDICKRHNLVLIEDAAHSIGTKYKGKGFGKVQLSEAVRRIKEYDELKEIRVCTNSNLIAPRNYESVGFVSYDKRENRDEAAFSGDYLYYKIQLR